MSILIGFVPREEKPVTFDQIKAGNYTVFNLQDSKTVEYTPIISKDRIAWPRQVAGGRERFDYPALGSIVVYVQNPLCINAIIPNSIECIVYVRAGPICEFMVPVQSCLTTVQYNYFKFTGQPGQAEPGYYPYYVGVSRYYRNGTKALLRHGKYLDHIAYFRNLRTDGYYKYSGDDAPVYREKTNGNWVASKYKVQYAVAIKDPGNIFYWLGIVQSEADAQSWCVRQSDLYLMTYPDDDADPLFSNNNAVWNFTQWPVVPPTKSVSNTTNTISSVIAQGRFDKHQTQSDFSLFGRTGHGLMLVGESFKSLTDLLRRPQYVIRFDIDGGLLDKNKSMAISPSGILSIDSSSTINVYIREGHISRYAQCHTWFKGGIILKLIFKSDSLILSNTVMVQHRPDITMIESDENDVMVGIANHTYASCIQNVVTNPVMTMYIPNYQEALYGMLGFPRGDHQHDLVRMANLGKLYISAQYACKVTVFQSCADDFKMFFFKGTPLVKYLDTFNSDSEKEVRVESACSSTYEMLDPQMAEDEVLPQGSLYSSTKKVEQVSEKASCTIDRLN